MLATTTTPKPKLDFTDPAPGFEHPETHNSSSALMTLGYHPPSNYHLPGTTHRTPTELSSHRNKQPLNVRQTHTAQLAAPTQGLRTEG